MSHLKEPEEYVAMVRDLLSVTSAALNKDDYRKAMEFAVTMQANCGKMGESIKRIMLDNF